MHPYSFLLICSTIGLIGIAGWASADLAQNTSWTNINTDPVLNGPDHPTTISFNEWVKITTISTYHWNYGQGDTPGSISLYHEDGTAYGPWGTIGDTGADGKKNFYWVSHPGESLKPGTYVITDSSPGTWSRNDASDNRGMAKVEYESVNSDGKPKGGNPLPVQTPSVVAMEEVKEGIQIVPGEIDPMTLSGEETDSLHVPVIRQVSFIPLSRAVSGGDPVYATLTVKNIGERDLKDGYVRVGFMSRGNLFSYRGGMAKIPDIPAGKERNITLILPTEAPELNEKGTELKNEAVACLPYRIEGAIVELMNGGYFVDRGTISSAGDNMVEFIGCCLEPSTDTTIRACEERANQTLK